MQVNQNNVTEQQWKMLRKHGITSVEELQKAIRNTPKLDIGLFTTPYKDVVDKK